MSTQPKDAGLVLSRAELYPPFMSDGIEVVTFSTTVPDTDALSFDYTVNGIAAHFQGVIWFSGHNRGHFMLERDFMTFCAGSWPVRFEVRAFRDGIQVDSAVALLHDTRNMVVHRCEAQIGPNPTYVTPEVTNTATAGAVFFDERGVQLPDAELSWELLLPQSLPGLVVEGRMLRVHPEAEPGQVSLVVRERSGMEQPLSLSLLPGEDIGLELSVDHLYPPLRNPRPAFVYVRDAWPNPDEIDYTFTVNGKHLGHGGVTLQKIQNAWSLIFDNTFVHNVVGAWPAKLLLQAQIDKSVIDTKVLWLHDTRSMECTRVDMELLPSDTVSIPLEGYAATAAAPRLYDAQGILLPHEELDWHADLPEPVQGVSLLAHVVMVSPQASPGQFEVVMHGPNDLSRARVMTLL